jgi:hypothetical protein
MRSRKQLAQPPARSRILLNEVCHGCASAVDQLDPQVAVAALADTEQPGLATRRALPRCLAQPGRKIPPPGEARCIADRREQRGCIDDADARNGRKGACPVIVAGQRRQFVIIGPDPPIEVRSLVAQISEQSDGMRAARHLPAHEFVEPLAQGGPSLGRDDARFEKNPAQLVRQPCARRHEPLTSPMQYVVVELYSGAQPDFVTLALAMSDRENARHSRPPSPLCRSAA